MLDALDGVVISDAERASLAGLAGFEAHTVKNITEVITRILAIMFFREVSDLPTTGDLAESGP